MTISMAASGIAPATGARRIAPPARTLFVLMLLLAGVAGFVTTGSGGTAHVAALDGADLTRLLRAMAALKAVMATFLAACVLWRMAVPVTLPWFLAYGAACAAMAVGPGLIWGLVHVGAGAALLHGGLLAVALLLWRDPTVGARLATLVATRRAALRT